MESLEEKKRKICSKKIYITASKKKAD